MQIAMSPNGKRFLRQSEQYVKYERNAGWFLKMPEGGTIDEPVNVQMLFFMPSRRKVDLSNLQSACLDVLVKHEILADDNCRIVVTHDGSQVFYDKEHPRTEIIITKKENTESIWK